MKRARELLLKERDGPTPEPVPKPSRLIHRVIVGAPPRFLALPPRSNLFGGPFGRPAHAAAMDPVMRLARLLPAADRWGKTWPAAGLFELPLRRTERRSDLCSTSAGAEMRGGGEFLRHVQHARLQNFRHVLHALQGESRNLRQDDSPTVLRSPISKRRW